MAPPSHQPDDQNVKEKLDMEKQDLWTGLSLSLSFLPHTTLIIIITLYYLLFLTLFIICSFTIETQLT
jgi:hypothetical protein